MAGKPWSPLKAALIAFLLTLVIGAGLALAIIISRGLLHDDPEHRGRLVGRALAAPALIIAAITYFVVRARRRHGQ